MTSLAIALQVSLLASAAQVSDTQNYQQARQTHVQTGRPLVVLVGADWCPACRTMKQSVIPEAQRKGVLSRVEFAQVNTDQQPELARKLMRSNSLPQLIVYYKAGNGWRRRELQGAQSVSAIEKLVTPPATPSIGR